MNGVEHFFISHNYHSRKHKAKKNEVKTLFSSFFLVSNKKKKLAILRMHESGKNVSGKVYKK